MDPIKNEENLPGPKPADNNDSAIQLNSQVLSNTSPSKQHPPKVNERTEDEEKICRKYIWGKCEKHQSQCRFLHVRDLPYMKKILKFCNDFQNHGCSWPNCTYLHTSREEKILFMNYDKIPQILLDRYAQMEAKAVSYVTPKPGALGDLGEPSAVVPSTTGTIRVIAPEICSHLPRVTVSRPFPPPVVITTAQTPQSTVTISQTTMTPQLNMTQININPMTLNPQVNINQQLKTNQTMASFSLTQMATSVQIQTVPKQNPLTQTSPQPSLYSSLISSNPPAPTISSITKIPSNTAISQLSTATNNQNYISGQFSINLKQPPPPIPRKFDKTKPPPIYPLPTAVSKDMGPLAKRICIGLPNATTTCRNETDVNQEDSELCVDCTQRRLSIDIFNKQIEKLMCEQNEKEIMYQQKLENLLNSKKSFLSIVGTEHKNVIEKYIDGSLDISSTLLMQTIMSSGRFSSVRKSNQIQLLPKLVESLLISNNNKDVREDYINNSISSLSHNNVPRQPEPVQSTQVQTMNQMLQQLLSLSGALLINNQMNPNASATNMPPNNAISPMANMNTLSNNQTQTTPLLTIDNGQVNIMNRIPQPDPSLRIYDPNMPPPNFTYYTTPNYGQPNGPPNALPPNAMPPNAMPPNAMPPNAMPPNAMPPNTMAPNIKPPNAMPPNAMPPTAMPPTAMPPNAMPPNAMPPNTMPQNIQIPYQAVIHPGPYSMAGGPGAPVTVAPGFGMPGPGIPVPGNHHPGQGMPQAPSFPPPMMPPVSAPLPPNMPPQQPAPPPEQLLYPPMTPYYYPTFH